MHRGFMPDPAGILVKAAGEFKSDLRIDKDGKKGDLKEFSALWDFA